MASGSVSSATKSQGIFLMQRNMLRFTLKDSPSLARTVTKHSGLEVISGNIKLNVVLLLFQDQERIEEA